MPGSLLALRTGALTMPVPPPPPTLLEVAQSRLAAYLVAEAKILESQHYQVGDGSSARMLRRADLDQVRLGIAEAQAEIARLQGAAHGRRVLYIR